VWSAPVAGAEAAGAERVGHRIIGGVPATIEKIPWQVAILANRDHNRGTAFQRQFCGGTLVAPMLVLTAGHCLGKVSGRGLRDPSRLAVLAGRTSLGGRGGAEVDVAEYGLPRGAAGKPLFENGGRPRWDAALVRLASPAPGSPIKIGGPGEEALWSPGQGLTASGWGAIRRNGSAFADRLRAVGLTRLHDATCAGTYRGRKGFHPEDQLCASGIFRDTCVGDSGGPVVAPTAEGPPRLVGVTSWGTGFCGSNAAVYARVAADPLRSELARLALEMTGDDIVGSGGSPATSPPALVADEALQLTLNHVRSNCRERRGCTGWGVRNCHRETGGFRCKGMQRWERRGEAARLCSRKFAWASLGDGQFGHRTLGRRWTCRRYRRTS
jgi:hypothetical protein